MSNLFFCSSSDIRVKRGRGCHCPSRSLSLLISISVPPLKRIVVSSLPYLRLHRHMTFLYLSVECHTFEPKYPPHSPQMIFDEKMLTQLYFFCSRAPTRYFSFDKMDFIVTVCHVFPPPGALMPSHSSFFFIAVNESPERKRL